MARPRKQVDLELLEELTSIGGNTDEVAHILRVSRDTLERRFSATLEKGRAHRKISLRRKQYEVAMRGNVAMLIWLGKNELGQKDRQQISSPGDQPLVPPAIKIQFVDAVDGEAPYEMTGTLISREREGA